MRTNALLVGWVKLLRDADWLTLARASAYSRILFVVAFVVSAGWIAFSRDGVDPTGKPLGTDFVSFWTASKIALSGNPADVYDMAIHRAQQIALFPKDPQHAAFFYPPTFLLICLPLAALPYLWSLVLWLGVTGFACWRILRAWLDDSVGSLPILAFPAMFINLAHGQNGFLSAALFGAGALMLNTRPLRAGVCLGALIYKPHLTLMIPVALIAARRWRTLLAFCISSAAFCALSAMVFGATTWAAFLKAAPLARIALEQNQIGNQKMQSIFAAVRLLHGDVAIAYGLQILVAVLACFALFYIHRRSLRSGAEGPAMVAAALLVSPFLLDYDFVLLGIPLAWFAREGRRAGFLPWEKTVLAVAFFTPGISRSVATLTLIPLGPIVTAAIFALILRRALAREHSDGEASLPAAKPIGIDSPVYASLTPSKVA
jgi:alpha-1,2-mannosyltransferase